VLVGSPGGPTRRDLAAPDPALDAPAGKVLYGPSGPPCKAWITHRLVAWGSLLGVDSGGIVGLTGPLLLLATPRLRLAALEVVAQRCRQTPLRRLLFPLFHLLAHADRLRLRQPCGKDRTGFGALCARVGTPQLPRLMLP